MRASSPGKRAKAARRVAELAWAGRHAQAIELATSALGSAEPGERIDLLDLRCESHLAQGDLARARDDVTALVELAGRTNDPARVAQAGNRLAMVQIHAGDSRTAIATAESALASARAAKDQVLEATSLLRLAEACMRVEEIERAIAAALDSARLFRAAHRPAGEGRALWALSAARSNLGHAREAQRAGQESLAIARRCGDLYGIGNATNILTFDEQDLAVQMALLKESLAAFTRAGYAERRGIITHNLGDRCYDLGLYRRARRHFSAARDAYRATGARGAIARSTWMASATEAALGNLNAARDRIHEAIAEIQAIGAEGYAAFEPLLRGRLALWEGDAPAAIPHLREAAAQATEKGQHAGAILALTWLTEALLAYGVAEDALATSTRATLLHAGRGLQSVDGFDPQALWHVHSLALEACRQRAAARRAMQRAYDFVVRRVATLGDEGLRRNFLNKVDEHRRIIAAWLAIASPRALRAPSHLAGEGNPREPFERLADTGLRLNEIRSSPELREFLIDEAVELSGAERVLLVLESPEGRLLAGAQLPRGEDATRSMSEIQPMLDQVQRLRAPYVDHVPESAALLAQRSRIVVPLVAQQELIGYLYADIDGRYGRFHDTDRDLLAMLASQAAVALANARASEELEAKVVARTDELRTSNTLLEARAAELAIINSVQQALAGELSMQGVYDVVGDKIREVFHTARRRDPLVRSRRPASSTSRTFTAPSDRERDRAARR